MLEIARMMGNEDSDLIQPKQGGMMENSTPTWWEALLTPHFNFVQNLS